MTTRHIRIGGLLALIAALLPGVIGLPGVRAQDGDDNAALLFSLVSAERDNPLQFQPLAPGEIPVIGGFVPRLDVTTDTDPTRNLIYISIANTAWSTGSIGILSDAIDPDARYVALQLRRPPRPDIAYDLQTNGRGLAFELEHVEDLRDGQPGLRLDVVLNAGMMFGVFRVTEVGGASFTGQTHVREGAYVNARTVRYQFDPAPLLGPFVLDCHILALPETPAPPPVEVPAAAEEAGETPLP